MRQYAKITRARNSLSKDDRIDAIALALAELKEWAEVDPTVAGIKNAEKARLEIMEEWENNPRMCLDHFTFLSDSVKHTHTTRKPKPTMSRWGWGRR